MKIGYTEFSFGYAFTENLIRSLKTGPVGAPIFPNLVQEAQVGYDIRINLPGCPIFFQYKLPELMVKNTAAEISQYNLPGIQVRFFRMSLMRRDLSRQHELLMEWEGRFPAKVFYATPCLQNVQDFNAAYGNAQVHQRSIFFSPCEIGALPDDKPHSIAYRDGLNFGYVCSEPREVPARVFGDVEKAIRQSFGSKRFQSLERVSHDLRKEVLEALPPPLRSIEGAIRENIRSRRSTVIAPGDVSSRTQEVADDILVSRELARVGLGIDLLIAQPSDDVAPAP